MHHGERRYDPIANMKGSRTCGIAVNPKVQKAPLPPSGPLAGWRPETDRSSNGQWSGSWPNARSERCGGKGVDERTPEFTVA